MSSFSGVPGTSPAPPERWIREITPLYVKFAVAETGTLSGKNAKAKAEIKVITDALGPVAKDLIKKKFEEGDSE
ncbi:hypothetical protein [Pseudomonas sp. JS425]|uniref:hypothetical protein n=1 Tax=Pseudomonas sp. JS425 TaxID=2829498 RepID=UPI001BB0278B|nr:hypothetical protein [Pseudomonas sp. JS425]QUN66335.1 hypothetical protein KDB76_20995 [Pseudomonas sp. JS425]